MLIDEFLTDGVDKENSFQYTNYSNKYVVIDGIKELLLSSETEIIVKIKKGELSVKGNNLLIKELSKDQIFISGEIISIT